MQFIVAKALEVSQYIISTLWNRFLETRNVCRGSRQGCMPATTQNKDCYLLKGIYSNLLLHKLLLKIPQWNTFVNQDCLKPFTPVTNQVQNYAKKAQGKKGGKQKLMQLSDEEMADAIDIQEYRAQLNEIQEKLKKDFVENLSLRSSASNIDNLLVKLGDEEYPLHELAQISKKNPNLIAINMSDFPEALKPAIQAIIDSGSGMNPQQEGTMIYLTVPKLTREHREKLAKNAKAVFIKAKEDIRDVQNYFMKDVKQKTDLSEDLIFSTSNHIKLLADQASVELEKILKIKQKELLGES
ncbi:ribosome-recycling factor, mitochondrial [Trichonephila clavata]|uniref:Ribosome-recycling factor, mitochondrial n=1 Tax=Trichonephila clavata TaxID=2740835 RepID=A0A8X6L925_TRICU|nr:ribosome-recycling factor, mitochondrial [Trichonephila clavata]